MRPRALRSVRWLVVAAGIAAGVAAGCAPPKPIPVPAVSAPKFPEFVAPTVPASLAATPAAEIYDRGWRFLQAGDLRTAEREFSLVLKIAPAFYPAETSLGYVELARKDARAALPHFDRALERQTNDVPALLGRAQSLLALNHEPEALTAFEAALAVDPSLADVKRRVEVLAFRILEQQLARARQAARAGKLDEAIATYTAAIASSPDSAVLYRELAAVERQKGDVDRALEHFRKAASLDTTDARPLVQIGELLESRGDGPGAEKAYEDALAIEPTEAVRAKLDTVRERAELAHLPGEYRALEEAPQLTRGDLAALIGVRLGPLLEGSRRAVVITDVRAHWAAPWIMAVTRSGVMEPFSNHTFQPRTLVRRVDLAQAMSRLLARIAAADPSRARAWASARTAFADLSPGHLAYPAASAAVAAGVMTIGPDNAFQPSRTVSGAEALAAIARIEALAGPGATKGRQ
jgi:Tfp pilus assembly protein PilF